MHHTEASCHFAMSAELDDKHAQALAISPHFYPAHSADLKVFTFIFYYFVFRCFFFLVLLLCFCGQLLPSFLHFGRLAAL